MTNPQPAGEVRRSTPRQILDVISLIGIVLTLGTIGSVAAYTHLFPDSELAHRLAINRLTGTIAAEESALRELEEALAATDARFHRAGDERSWVKTRIAEVGSDLAARNSVDDDELGPLIVRRTELGREMDVLAARHDRLAVLVTEKRTLLSRTRAEKARHVEALHSNP